MTTLYEYLHATATDMVDTQRPGLEGEEREAEILLVTGLLLEHALPFTGDDGDQA